MFEGQSIQRFRKKDRRQGLTLGKNGGHEAHDQRALHFWSEQYGRLISTEELMEIRRNISRFVKLILKLENRNRFNGASPYQA